MKNRVTYPSPTAASLGRYGEYPVSLYNGLVNIGQQLFEIQSGRLAVDISLSYHSGGNKPADIPSWVGLGFSLNAGGAITRVVRGLPDDVFGGYYLARTELLAQLNNYVPNNTFMQHYVWRSFDDKSDRYLFNFNGKAGEFIFGLDGQIRFINGEPFEISFDQSGTYGFESFTVKTGDGITYTFSQHEKSRYHSPNNTIEFYTSTWYLKKMENENGDIIVFNYSVPVNKYRYKQYKIEKFAIGQRPGPAGYLPINVNTTVTSSQADQVIYLSEIVFNGGKLVFSTTKRNDPFYQPNGVPLSAIEERKLENVALFNGNNVLLRKWVFTYIENSNERLKLNTLSLSDNTGASPQTYAFGYNSTKLPINASGNNPYYTNRVDYWGYLNGIVTGTSRIPYTYSSYYNDYFGSADRNPHGENMKAEILQKITYPTGGYTEFVFEANTYSMQGDSYADNPFVNYEWQTSSFEYEEGYFSIDPSTQTFTLTSPSLVEVSREISAGGPNHAWLPSGTFITDNYQFAAGTYNLQDIFGTDELLQPSNSDIRRAIGTVRIRVATPTTSKLGGGLRIKSIKNFDGTELRTKHFEYKLDNSASSGVLSVFPAHFVDLNSLWSNTHGILLSSEPINDIPQGPPIGYKQVDEIFPDGSMTVHKYHTYIDYPDDYNEFVHGYTDMRLAPLNSINQMRGLEKSSEVYTAEGVMVKKTENEYEILTGASVYVPAIDLKPTIDFEAGGGSSFDPISGILISNYNEIGHFVYLKSKKVTDYDLNGLNPVVSNTRYFYDNTVHRQLSRTELTSSDGGREITYTSYPHDYANTSGFIKEMKDRHLIGYPIEQVRYKEVGTTRTVLSGSITTYKTGGKGLVDQVLALEAASPVPLASFRFSNRTTAGQLPPSVGSSANYSPDTRYKPRLTYNEYDTKGNPLQYTQADGVPVSYVWGYGNQYPVAEIRNAARSAVVTALGGSTGVTNFGNQASPSEAAVTGFLSPLRSAATLKQAQVMTYTYKPLIGMSSSTDASGRTTYYDYDGFGRLWRARDHFGNVTEEYKYNYRP
ncbi:hypothetical protein ACFOET_18095 [Parapedobacter deserti]|uniref:YD repeat-containing protein n=1 Tax=Parapedobacter deserti TaxID=1912957 RepID=A0ABV7JN74_9SPHI